MVKARPQLILPEELASVKDTLQKHPKSHNYRVAVKNDQIIIYESQGTDFGELFGSIGWTVPDRLGQEFNERHAHFSPIMRFILDDTEERIFSPQRWCFLGSIDTWINAGTSGKIDYLVKLIPKLGTDDFYEIY